MLDETARKIAAHPAMAAPSDPAVSAPWERERLEIERLRQELRHGVARTAIGAAAVLAALLLVGGYLYERSQERAERRLARMVAVGAQYDELFAATQAFRAEPAPSGAAAAAQRSRRESALRERWLRAELQPTPDFRALFGDELAAEWPRVSRAALDLLEPAAVQGAPGAPVELVANRAADAAASFDSAGRSFREKLYRRVTNR